MVAGWLMPRFPLLDLLSQFQADVKTISGELEANREESSRNFELQIASCFESLVGEYKLGGDAYSCSDGQCVDVPMQVDAALVGLPATRSEQCLGHSAAMVLERPAPPAPAATPREGASVASNAGECTATARRSDCSDGSEPTKAPQSGSVARQGSKCEDRLSEDSRGSGRRARAQGKNVLEKVQLFEARKPSGTSSTSALLPNKGTGTPPVPFSRSGSLLPQAPASSSSSSMGAKDGGHSSSSHALLSEAGLQRVPSRDAMTKPKPMKSEPDLHATTSTEAAKLLSQQPRPGGLLDAMRVRGTLPQAGAPAKPPQTHQSAKATAPAVIRHTSTSLVRVVPPAPSSTQQVEPPAVAQGAASAPVVKSTLTASSSSARLLSTLFSEAAGSTPRRVGGGHPTDASEAQRSLQGVGWATPRSGVERNASSTPRGFTTPTGASVVEPAASGIQILSAKSSKKRLPMMTRNDALPSGTPSAASSASRELVKVESWQKLRKLPLQEPKRPEDNYEISDKEDNCDDSMAQSFERAQKHVPTWCQSYLDQLATQTNVDPDTIFGTSVPACDLDAIFPDSLYKMLDTKRIRRRRGSSAEWKQDRLRAEEVRTYKTKTGQVASWEEKLSSRMRAFHG
mmetsp:Transcript_38381/g.90250  ORF Transcript_38381/g.90250 Transcript_38381/m.90250 type:complete len:627 (+) Transcript_38381:53-1933(+)